jgi:accessory gene regulator protein AgrB
LGICHVYARASRLEEIEIKVKYGFLYIVHNLINFTLYNALVMSIRAIDCQISRALRSAHELIYCFLLISSNDLDATAAKAISSRLASVVTLELLDIRRVDHNQFANNFVARTQQHWM